jgi:uncharacterized protein
MRQYLTLILIAAAILAVRTASPASAVDCVNANSSVEKTICQNADLKKAEENFNARYAHLIDLLDRRQSQEIVEQQTQWITERDRACAPMQAEAIANCIRDALRQRRTDLALAFSHRRNFGSVTVGKSGATIVVGNEVLEVQAAHDGDMDILRLIHGNTLLAESYAPFEIDGRGGDETAEAVVISTHDYGSLGCSAQYLISARPHQPLRMEALKNDACALGYSVKKNARGLELTLDATPRRKGVVKVWTPQNERVGFERSLGLSPSR